MIWCVDVGVLGLSSKGELSVLMIFILVLVVIGVYVVQFGSCSQKVFEGCDGSIGCLEDCDWVLSLLGVLCVYVMICCFNGIYFIEDCSINGMLFNGVLLVKGEFFVFKYGDCLQIDLFEVLVNVQVVVFVVLVFVLVFVLVDIFVILLLLLILLFFLCVVDLLDDFLDLGLGLVVFVGGGLCDGGLIFDVLFLGGVDFDLLSFFDVLFVVLVLVFVSFVLVMFGWNYIVGMEDYFCLLIIEGQCQVQVLLENWDLIMGDFVLWLFVFVLVLVFVFVLFVVVLFVVVLVLVVLVLVMVGLFGVLFLLLDVQ